MVRICSHLTQPLSWSTTHCWLSGTAYSIYSQLPSILEAVSQSPTWEPAMPWWQGPTYLGYIAYCDGFIVTNDSEDVFSLCIINITVCICIMLVSNCMAYICMLKHQIIVNVNKVSCHIYCLGFRTLTLYSVDLFSFFFNLIRCKIFTEII
jgi:hypothetical protein